MYPEDKTFDQINFREQPLPAGSYELCTFDNCELSETDFRTARGYRIDPDNNRIRKAKFSLSGVAGLLAEYDISLEGL